MCLAINKNKNGEANAIKILILLQKLKIDILYLFGRENEWINPTICITFGSVEKKNFFKSDVRNSHFFSFPS